MTSNKIIHFTDDLFQTVLSENLVGIDFIRLYKQSALLELVRLTEEMGLYHLDYSNNV